MKVIAEGTKYDPYEGTWECASCKRVVELARGDRPPDWNIQKRNDSYRFAYTNLWPSWDVLCPTCGGWRTYWRYRELPSVPAPPPGVRDGVSDSVRGLVRWVAGDPRRRASACLLLGVLLGILL